MQQESPESVLSDVVHAPKDREDRKNELRPGRKFIPEPIKEFRYHHSHAVRKEAAQPLLFGVGVRLGLDSETCKSCPRKYDLVIPVVILSL